MKHESNLAVKICEKLPLDITIFAKNGRCQIVDYCCPYQLRKNNSDLIICRKKTTTSIPLSSNFV
jgi:hypothetical protein